MTRRRRHISIAILAGAAVVPTVALASPVLLLPAADPTNENGIGLSQWTQMTADLSTAAGGQIISSSAALDDLPTLESFSGLWVDLGYETSTLTSAETSNLETYIQTGRRVVMIGGDPTYAMWDSSLLAAVGGTATTSKFVGSTPTRSYVGLTTGVSSLATIDSGVAASGTSLFQDRVATLWGPAANALVLLDPNVMADEYLPQGGNTPFASDVASWIAGGLGSTANWKTSVGGTWSTAGSWSTGEMPSVADSATFNLGRNSAVDFGYSVAIPTSKAVANVSVLADKVTFALSAGTSLNVSQAITVLPPASQAGALTLSGSNTGAATVTAASVSLGGNSGSTAMLSVGTGVNLTAATATLAAGSTLQVNGGSLHLSGGATGSGALNQISGSSTIADGRLDSLSIGGGTVAIAPSTASDRDTSVSILNTLSIGQSGSTFLGTLDLSDNDLIVESGDIATLTAALASGYDGGKWDGPGIDSSAAADDASHRMALGILVNADGSGHKLYGQGAPLGLFDGQDPAYDAILIRYTLYGDNDLSEAVTSADVARDVSGAGNWATGDFNYDGVVDSTDAAIQAAALSGASPVPEPAMVVLGPVAGLLLTRRRIRNARRSRPRDTGARHSNPNSISP